MFLGEYRGKGNKKIPSKDKKERGQKNLLVQKDICKANFTLKAVGDIVKKIKYVFGKIQKRGFCLYFSIIDENKINKMYRSRCVVMATVNNKCGTSSVFPPFAQSDLCNFSICQTLHISGYNGL